MALLVYAVMLIAAAGFVAAAFLYNIDPRQASAILRTVGIAALTLLFLPVIAGQFFGGSSSLQVFLGLIVLSITAYAIREARNPRKEPTKKTGHAERTPVLPSKEFDE